MKLKENLKLRQVGNRYMIVDAVGQNVNLTNVYTLNATAAWVWELAAQGDFTEESLISALCENFEVSTDLATKDIRALLETWKKYNLLVA